MIIRNIVLSLCVIFFSLSAFQNQQMKFGRLRTGVERQSYLLGDQREYL